MSSEQLLTPPSKSKASLSDRLMPKAWARSMILKHLGTMQRGQLVIKESGEKTVYGDQSDNVPKILSKNALAQLFKEKSTAEIFEKFKILYILKNFL